MYHTYCYLDPNKKGNYVYGSMLFEYEPFYVGKGKGNRHSIHFSKCRNSKRGSNPFYDKLNKMLLSEINPIILKLSFHENEEQCLLDEKNLINLIGKRSDGKGPLLNLTDGGIGGDTYSSQSDDKKKEIREKRSKSMLGKNKRKMSDAQKEKLRNAAIDQFRNTKSVLNKKIIQMDKDLNQVKMWESLKSTEERFGKGSRFNIYQSMIRNGFAYGYKWKYYE